MLSHLRNVRKPVSALSFLRCHGPNPRQFANISLSSKSFPCLRDPECRAALVDKTGPIAEFLAGGPEDVSHRAIFTRPAQFGKTLFLSIAAHMLAAGELPPGVNPWPGYVPIDTNALFGGLNVHERVAKGDTALGTILRRPHFVITLSLDGAQSGVELKSTIQSILQTTALTAFGENVKVDVAKCDTPDAALRTLIAAVPKEIPIAILVDDYDTAITRDIENGNWTSARQGVSTLRSLLNASHSLDLNPRISKFILAGETRLNLTGGFTAVSSGFSDLTADPRIGGALGFTGEEIRTAFPQELKRLAEGLGKTEDQALDELDRWFGGYSYATSPSTLIPLPVLRSLKEGTISAPAPTHTQSPSLADFDSEKINTIALLIQKGILSVSQSGHFSIPNQNAVQSIIGLVDRALSLSRSPAGVAQPKITATVKPAVTPTKAETPTASAAPASASAPKKEEKTKKEKEKAPIKQSSARDFGDLMNSPTATCDRKFKNPWGVTVDPTSGVIHVTCQTDWGDREIHSFDAKSGKPLSNVIKFGAEKEDAYEDDGPADITVHPTTGNIFVCDYNSDRIQAFSQSGTLLFSLSDENLHAPYGFAFDTQNGEVHVCNYWSHTIGVYSDRDGRYLRSYGGAGSGPGQFDRPMGVAINPQTGVAYVVDGGSTHVSMFKVADGSYLGSFGELGNTRNKFIAVSQSSGHVAVADQSEKRILIFTGDGEQVGEIGDLEGVGAVAFGPEDEVVALVRGHAGGHTWVAATF